LGIFLAPDLFYDVLERNAYRFSYISSVYQWELIDNVDVIKVLSNASRTQGSLDSELRLFVATPQPPYSIQDLWRQQSSGDFKICIVERLTGSYVNSDWIYYTEYTDDVAGSITKALTNKAQTDATSALVSLDEIADGGKITKTEKTTVLKPIWDSIVAEYDSYINQAEYYGVDTTAYTLSYSGAGVGLYDYLYVVPSSVYPYTGDDFSILGNMTKTSNVDRITFDSKFTTYYFARSVLSENITSAGKIYVENKFDEITEDSKLNAIEKRIIQSEWDAIMKEKVIISNKSDLLYDRPLCSLCQRPHSTDVQGYTPAYNDLVSYIPSLQLSLSTVTEINRTDFNTKFNAYYYAKSVILQEIDEAEDSGTITILQSNSTMTADIANALSTANNAQSIATTALGTANNAVATANDYTSSQIASLLTYIDNTYVRQ